MANGTKLAPRTPVGPGGIGLGPESPDAIRESTSSEKLWDALETLKRLGIDTPVGKLSYENLMKLWQGETPEEQVNSAVFDLGLNPVAVPVRVGEKLGVHGTRSLFDFFRTKKFGHTSQPYHEMINIAGVNRQLPEEKAMEEAARYASAVAAEPRFGSVGARPGGAANVRNIPITPAQDISILDFHTKYDPNAITPEEAEMIAHYLTTREGDDYYGNEFLKRYRTLRNEIEATAQGQGRPEYRASYEGLQHEVPESLYEEHPTIKGFSYGDSTTGHRYLPDYRDSSAPVILKGKATAIAENTPLKTPWGVPLTEVADESGFLPGFGPTTTKEAVSEIEPRFVVNKDWPEAYGQKQVWPYMLEAKEPWTAPPIDVMGPGGKPKYSEEEVKWLVKHEPDEFNTNYLDDLVDYFTGAQGNKKLLTKKPTISYNIGVAEAADEIAQKYSIPESWYKPNYKGDILIDKVSYLYKMLGDSPNMEQFIEMLQKDPDAISHWTYDDLTSQPPSSLNSLVGNWLEIYGVKPTTVNMSDMSSASETIGAKLAKAAKKLKQK